ncbi:MAG: hypothetical protein H6639_01575 [Caldilineaceae bacterium]|nr:hypothetical protein [Caldilineaceae bacterium]
MSDSFARPRHPFLLIATAIGILLVSLAFFGSASAAATLIVDPSNCASGSGNYCSIQDAIDAAAVGDTIHVYPGSYSETATNRATIQAAGYQFGLFIDKDNLTIQGVKADGSAVASYAEAAATVTTNATNSFGYSGIFVQSSNVTIAGLRIGANTPTNNKTIEVIGDNFTVRNCDFDVALDVDGYGGSVYLNDWRYDTVTAQSYVKQYAIENNRFQHDMNITIASGVGMTGDVSTRRITGNTFEFDPAHTATAISFSGAGGVPWYVYPVGGAVIENNSFQGGTQYIRARGDYKEAEFDWAHFWQANTFDKAVVALVDYPSSPFSVRTYSYTTSGYTFTNVRRIGAAIQGAIDNAQPGDTIKVAAGTYVEQPLITKNLTLIGAGSGTVIKAPATLVSRFTTTDSWGNVFAQYPVLTVSGANATVRGLVIDGDGRGNSAYKFNGIAYYNAGGAIISTEIKGVRNNPFDGAQSGVAIYAYLVDGSTRNLAIRNNYIHDFQKNGMAVNSGGSSVLTTQIVGNHVVGGGPTGVTAQNGIQVYRASGTLDGYIDSNTVSGIAYTGASWVASTILNFYADVDVTNNVLLGGHVGVYNIDAQGAIANNKVEVIKAGGYGWGIIASDPPQAVPSPYEVPMAEAAAGAASTDNLVTTASATELAVNVSGNIVTFADPDNSSTFGIEADAGYGQRNLRITANRNAVSGFEVGLEFYQCGSSCTSAVFTGVTANYNNVAGNTIGMRSNASYLTADGTNNWWGAPSGPSGAGSGSGAQVTQYINFTPWLGAAPNVAVLSVPATPILLQRTDPKVINVPIILAPEAGDQIASVAFSVDYDQSCLSTSAAKVTGLPAGFQTGVAFDAADTDGEIDVAIWSEVSNPLVLSAGTLLSIEFAVTDSPACWGTDHTVDVLFSNQPAPSFGDPGGQTLFRTAVGASIPLDFNSFPTDFALSATSVAENVPADTVVGTFSNNDPDVDTFVYTLVSGAGADDNASFTIVANQLKINASPDFEAKSSYSILVQLNDGKGGVVTKQFTITITNVNDTPTDITLSNDKVFEAAPANTVIGTFSTVDQDSGDTFTYALVSGTGDTDNGAFTITGSQLSINASPDFATQSSYSIRVRSTDAGGLSFEKEFTIHVIDRSELSLPVETEMVWVAYSGNLQVPVHFAAQGNAVRSASFSIDYAEACLTFTGLSGFQSGWSGSAGTPTTSGIVGIALNGSTDLASGTAVVLNFSANDACTSGTVSPITLTGATSLADVSNIPLPALTLDGAVHIVANDARGDCNSDDIVNAADFVAEVLESFDTNSVPASFPDNHWLYVHTGTFNGSAIGCDANASTQVDVADILCTVLVVFGDNSCTLPAVTTAAGQPAVLSLPAAQAAPAGATVEIPVSLRRNDAAVAGAAFRIGIDPRAALLDTADADNDGIPDGIRFNVPADLMRSVQVSEDGATIDIAIADLSLPLFELPDDVLVTVDLQVTAAGAGQPVVVSLTNASLGSTGGVNVPVEIEVAGQEAGNQIFLPVMRR